MQHSSIRRIATLLSLALFAILLFTAGCKKKTESTDSAAGPSPAQAANASALMQTNGCGRCHGGGGGRRSNGPDLSHEGANPQHTEQWIADHIKNPQSHTPGSRMPSFAGKMADSDIQTVAAYLASLK